MTTSAGPAAAAGEATNRARAAESSNMPGV